MVWDELPTKIYTTFLPPSSDCRERMVKYCSICLTPSKITTFQEPQAMSPIESGTTKHPTQPQPQPQQQHLWFLFKNYHENLPHLCHLFFKYQGTVVEEVKSVVQRSVLRRGRRANRDLASLRRSSEVWKLIRC